jgi:hypothetical protein
MERRRRNLVILDKIFVRASRPGYWGKVELYFEDGELRPQFKIESTIRANGKNDGEIVELLDAAMTPGYDPSEKSS